MMAGRELAEPGASGLDVEASALPLAERLRLLQCCTLETMCRTWDWVCDHPVAYERTLLYDKLLAGAPASCTLPLQQLTARLVCLLFAVQVFDPLLSLQPGCCLRTRL